VSYYLEPDTNNTLPDQKYAAIFDAVAEWPMRHSETGKMTVLETS
jgi:hypothetical protein